MTKIITNNTSQGTPVTPVPGNITWSQPHFTTTTGTQGMTGPTGTHGFPGPAGMDGANGRDFGMHYLFDTSLSGEIDHKRIRFDRENPKDISVVTISYHDSEGNNLRAYMETWGEGTLAIRDGSVLMFFGITSALPGKDGIILTGDSYMLNDVRIPDLRLITVSFFR